jgi:hypothetical protein
MESKAVLLILKVDGSEYAAMYAEDEIGLDRIFRRAAQGKPLVAEDEAREGFDVSSEKIEFTSEADCLAAAALVGSVLDYVQDYNHAKGRNVYARTLAQAQDPIRCERCDLREETKVCDECGCGVCEDRGCIRGSLCTQCSGEYCGVCDQTPLVGDGNEEKQCDDCDRICCIQCIAITGCQTTTGVCVECFTYTCHKCKEAPLEKKLYIWDSWVEEKPYCGGCIEKKQRKVEKKQQKEAEADCQSSEDSTTGLTTADTQ